MNKRAIRYHWEDFPAGHRQELGHTAITREQIVGFASQFDPQPFHLDDEAARQTPFGALCASGWHTCSIAMRLMCDGYLLEAASVGSPGLEHLRWLAPVFPGDTLHLAFEVLEARVMASRPDTGLVRMRWEMHNQHGRKVLQMDGWQMFLRREARAA